MKLLFYLIFIVSPLTGGELSGKIQDSSGAPIENVSICTTSWFCTKSNKDGSYKIANNPWGANFTLSPDGYTALFRFNKHGYKAITTVVSSENLDIVLEKAIEGYNEWFIPSCSVDKGFENKLIGNTKLKVAISNKISEIKSYGGDYESLAIPISLNNEPGIKNDYLIFMDGPSVSRGFPEWWSVSLEIIYDRDVVYKNQLTGNNGISYLSFIDMKAGSKDGKFYRFIGSSVEIIYYEGVSEETANIFDNILESLCVSQ